MKKITLLTMSSLLALGQVSSLSAMQMDEVELQSLKTTLLILPQNTTQERPDAGNPRVPRFNPPGELLHTNTAIPFQETSIYPLQKNPKGFLPKEELQAEKAKALKGDLGAMKTLANHYENLPFPRSPDFFKALKWYEKAADLGDTESKYAYVRFTLNVDKKLSSALDSSRIGLERMLKPITYLNSLCKVEDTKALELMAYISFTGKISAADKKRAFEYWALAAKKGHIVSSCHTACHKLDAAENALCPLEERDKYIREALESLIAACKKGSDRAFIILCRTGCIDFPEETKTILKNERGLTRDDWPLKLAQYITIEDSTEDWVQVRGRTIMGQYFLKNNNKKEALEHLKKSLLNEFSYVKRLDDLINPFEEQDKQNIIKEKYYARYYSVPPRQDDLSDPGLSDNGKRWEGFLTFLSQSPPPEGGFLETWGGKIRGIFN